MDIFKTEHPSRHGQAREVHVGPSVCNLSCSEQSEGYEGCQCFLFSAEHIELSKAAYIRGVRHEDLT